VRATRQGMRINLGYAARTLEVTTRMKYPSILARRAKSLVLAGALIAAVGVAGLAAAERIGRSNPPAVLKLAEETGPSRSGFAPVVKKVLPAVVNIASTKVSKVPVGMQGDDSDDSLFRQFFGNSMRPRQQA